VLFAESRADSVDYALTELGSSLYGLVEGLEKWAEMHIDDV
jgi:DNA-binding HxlR family transcriptional regulator